MKEDETEKEREGEGGGGGGKKEKKGGGRVRGVAVLEWKLWWTNHQSGYPTGRKGENSFVSVWCKLLQAGIWKKTLEWERKRRGEQKRRKRRRGQEKYLSRLLDAHALEMKDKQDGASATSSLARAPATPSYFCELRMRQRACISCFALMRWLTEASICRHANISKLTHSLEWRWQTCDFIWKWTVFFFRPVVCSQLYSCYDLAYGGITIGYQEPELLFCRCFNIVLRHLFSRLWHIPLFPACCCAPFPSWTNPLHLDRGTVSV